jgi:hypothetical protein
VVVPGPAADAAGVTAKLTAAAQPTTAAAVASNRRTFPAL